MKSNNNRNNRYQNEQNKNNKQMEQNINNFNLGKSHRNFGSAFSNLSDSTFGNFNPISNIRDSKLVKIKNITKKNTKPIYNQKAKEKEKPKEKPQIKIQKKEEEPSSDSDYGDSEDDDFNNILRESMSVQSFKTYNTNPFLKKEPKKEKQINENIDKNNLEKMTYEKINDHFNNDDFKNIFPKEEPKIVDNKINNNNPQENFIFPKTDITTNKSINMNDYITPIKNEIIPNNDKDILKNNNNNNNINNSQKEDLEYNLLEKNNIFNNNKNIINLDNQISKEPNYNIDIDELIEPEKKIENNILENENYKNHIINHNIFIDKKLKEIKFLEKLKSISDSRYLFFQNNYRKDNFFLDENNFDNVLISEKNLKIQSPLTLIFKKIFSPEEQPNFFKKIFSSENNSDYLSYYDQNELNKVPRFYKDLPYVNNLFNSFDFNELNNFLEEIKTWNDTFHLDQEYTHELKYFQPKKKYVSLKNNFIIYFISPYDLIIDSHLRASGIPFSDTVMAINQLLFHCDIKFDSKKGKFIFKTSVKILNSIKMVKNTAINNTIKEEGKNEADEEIINNIWTPMKKEILEQDLINQQNAEKIYINYLENHLNKFNNEVPNVYNDIKIANSNSEENWDSFSEKSNENNFGDDNINQRNINIEEMNERNERILKMGGYGLIGIYLFKIFFFSFTLDTIFGMFWIGLIGYLIYKFR
jgi:hypothetical protein